jgi:hypothetical protein
MPQNVEARYLRAKETLPDSKLLCLTHITGLRCLMSSAPQKWIKAHCSTTVQFEAGNAIFN